MTLGRWWGMLAPRGAFPYHSPDVAHVSPLSSTPSGLLFISWTKIQHCVRQWRTIVSSGNDLYTRLARRCRQRGFHRTKLESLNLLNVYRLWIMRLLTCSPAGLGVSGDPRISTYRESTAFSPSLRPLSLLINLFLLPSLPTVPPYPLGPEIAVSCPQQVAPCRGRTISVFWCILRWKWCIRQQQFWVALMTVKNENRRCKIVRLPILPVRLFTHRPTTVSYYSTL